MIEWTKRGDSDPRCNSCGADESDMNRLRINNGSSNNSILIFCHDCTAVLFGAGAPSAGRLADTPKDLHWLASIFEETLDQRDATITKLMSSIANVIGIVDRVRHKWIPGEHYVTQSNEMLDTARDELLAALEIAAVDTP